MAAIMLLPTSSVRSLSCGGEYKQQLLLQMVVVTYVLLQPLDLGQTVVAQVQLFEVDEALEALHLGNAIALDREDLEVGEGVEVLKMSAGSTLAKLHSTDSHSVPGSCSCRATIQ
jgi:hypothetical protein